MLSRQKIRENVFFFFIKVNVQLTMHAYLDSTYIYIAEKLAFHAYTISAQLNVITDLGHLHEAAC